MISLAYAQTAGAADASGGFMQLLPMILMFGVLWFLMIRPQMKKAKEHKALLAALQKGDEVVTSGGIAGKVIKVTDDFLVLEASDTVELKIQKSAVIAALPKGTLKAI